MDTAARQPLLKGEHLKQYFKVNKTFTVKAVDDISFEIFPGETYGLVGESGSGKSTTGRSIIRLYDPTGGTIIFNGENITGRLTAAQKKMLRTKMQMIFQDPMASLNPREKVIDIIAQGLDVHHLYKDAAERRDKVYRMLERVGLSHEHANRYPHQFSGGQRQRIGIARALVMNPDLVIADEAISALDVSIQAQILNLLMDLQESLGLTYMFVTHDLSVVKHISTNIMVMYLGKSVEYASSDELFENPLHPYTKALLAAIPEPSLAARGKEIKLIHGEVSSPINVKPGCRFAKRCEYCDKRCEEETPSFVEVKPGHKVTCFKVGENGKYQFKDSNYRKTGTIMCRFFLRQN